MAATPCFYLPLDFFIYICSVFSNSSMSTFEDRLQQFLDMEELSQARFADTLGIQRGGLSHLLSGRNKPSYDFIVKLIASYPTLNSEWLLTGKGKPYKNQPDEPERIQIRAEEPSQDFGELFSCTEENSGQTTDIQPEIKEIHASEPSENPINHNRTIERITIFYSDGTFEER